MAAGKKATTTVSTKGQVILPKAIRDGRQWAPGTRLVVEDTAEGVLLKSVPLFASTKSKDVYACLAHRGPAKTLKEMEAGIVEETKRRHARNRY